MQLDCTIYRVENVRIKTKAVDADWFQLEFIDTENLFNRHVLSVFCDNSKQLKQTLNSLKESVEQALWAIKEEV